MFRVDGVGFTFGTRGVEERSREESGKPVEGALEGFGSDLEKVVGV